MQPRAVLNHWPERARFVLLAALIIIAFLFGGASRDDALSAAIVQPAAVALATAALLVPGAVNWRAIRVPLGLLAALALLMLLQLIPLPASVWAALPGREPFVEVLRATGLPFGARALSVAPDLTLSSLASLATPFAVLILVAATPTRYLARLLPFLLGIALLSSLLGAAQLLSGEESPLYFYAVTNEGSAVGLFANRNHNSIFISAMLPVVAFVTAALAANRERGPTARWIGMATIILLLTVLGIIGSRAGLLLAPVAILLSIAVYRWTQRADTAQSSKLARAGVLAGGCIMLVVAAYLISGTEAARRLFETDASEGRLVAFPYLVDIAIRNFWTGTGFGTFDPVFRFNEPLEMLRPQYLNHAHNDLIELAITGGLPALLVLTAFLAWLGRSVVKIFTLSDAANGPGRGLAALGLSILAVLLISSLFDYPLRTPALASLAALAVGFVGNLREEKPR